MLKITNLIKSFGNKIAVNDISLSIEEGTLFGFIGPNGAGKTTTIKCVAGLIEFDNGEITVNNLNIKTQLSEYKRYIGYIPDTPFLYEKLTAREFLFFVGRAYNMNKKDIINQIEYYSELLEFKDYIDTKAEEYSHGMKQRIVIASAFIHRPKLILIDEPMVGLDPNIAKRVKELFINYTKENNTIFLSTHTLSLAEEICNKIGIMNYGKLIYIGDVKNIKQQLNNKTLEDVFLKITKENE